MGSSFGWVDYSEQERRKMVNLIHLFSQSETRDELGIGAVRDAFSNLLFPGTSTIQTRLKYMLFVPWIYKRLEELRIPSADVSRKARLEEIKLIYALLGSEDTSGVVGKEAKDLLQRLPSNIYWSGLKTWGIRGYRGSQDEYHRYVDHHYRMKKGKIFNDDKEPISQEIHENWDSNLPPYPRDFPKISNFNLTKVEADYLQEKIRVSCKGSLLAHLATSETYYSNDIGDYVWEYPGFGTLPGKIQNYVGHAQNFSDCMQGASLLYNLMLAESSYREDWVEKYNQLIAQWAKLIAARYGELKKWDTEDFWQVVGSQIGGITPRTEQFINEWLIVVRGQDVSLLSCDQAVRKLISGRELVLKRQRARLHNQRALELWTGESGTGKLNYRWPIVKTMMADLWQGVGGEVNA